MEIPSNQRIRVRVRGPRPSSLPRRLSLLLGLALSLLPTSVHARGKHAVSPRRAPTAAPPWSGTSGFPPPRPLVRVGGPPSETRPAPPIDHTNGNRKESSEMTHVEDRSLKTPVHPAWHRTTGTARTPSGRLFPRAGRPKENGAGDEARRERAAAMARHPAGKISSTHRVRYGDTLWQIAAEALQTEDHAAIASYWPRVYETNRDVIGTDPDKLFPGQVLRLPSCDR